MEIIAAEQSERSEGSYSHTYTLISCISVAKWGNKDLKVVQEWGGCERKCVSQTSGRCLLGL